MPIKPGLSTLFTGLVLACTILTGPGRAQTAVDLQIVLAVDTSGSVDGHEFALQLSGIAAALRDATVLAAIRSGPNARIAVSVVLWSDPSLPQFSTPWRLLTDAASAADFARRIEQLPRVRSGGTGIGKAIQFCADLFRDNGLSSRRRVIDLSGDGAEPALQEWSVSPRQARDYAVSNGITINGLAILTDDPELDSYYRDQVIGGPDAFLLAVESLDDFAAAMRRKLVREIEYRPTVSQLAN